MTILETNPKGTKPEADMTYTCTDGNELSCQVEMAGAVWIQKPAQLFSQKTISRLESHRLLPASSVSFIGLCFFQMTGGLELGLWETTLQVNKAIQIAECYFTSWNGNFRQK